jgi:hypothetical protein
MSYYRVTESWDLHYSHDEELDPNYNPAREKGYSIAWTEEEQNLWHDYISNLVKEDRFILPSIDYEGMQTYSEYYPLKDSTIYVVKKFKDLEGAQGYVNIMKSLGDPVVMKIEFVAGMV